MSRFRTPVLLARLISSSATVARGSGVSSQVVSLSDAVRHSATLRQSLPQSFLQLPTVASTTSGSFVGFAAARSFAAAATEQRTAANGGRAAGRGALAVEEEPFSAITDKHIPQRPVSPVEATSYMVVIVAGLAVAAAVLWAAVNELLIQPVEYTCFNLALEKIKEDPRATVRLGTPIAAYGQESRNRAARQRIPHRAYSDASGLEHHQVQFHVKGPTGASAVVHASMHQDDAKQWQYEMLYLDFVTPIPQRVMIVGQQH